MGDIEREIHGGGAADVPGDGEALADVRGEIAAIEGGDTSAVAPWRTPTEALADLRAEEAVYRARLAS